ncbi:helix-turn-helix domain-containing protein, partial [Escherichia coli]|nr:helix-turn-helix domain-containing protein [Escherichia coli]HDK0920768.1 helix-turn-helix domain-containing protein [Escherichia coli]
QKAASSLTLQQCPTEIAHQLSIARSTVYKILEDERAS